MKKKKKMWRFRLEEISYKILGILSGYMCYKDVKLNNTITGKSFIFPTIFVLYILISQLVMVIKDKKK